MVGRSTLTWSPSISKLVGGEKAVRNGLRTEREIVFLNFQSLRFFQQTYSFADYFTVGCKTEDGFTVILVERGPGVETKPIKTSYSPTAGTAYITFDNVRVPIGNTLGEEGGGIFVILRYFYWSLRYPWTLNSGMPSNFNHERWVMCCGSARSQRTISELLAIIRSLSPFLTRFTQLRNA